MTRGAAGAASPRTRWEVAGLALVLALAACLRLWQIREPLWLDELHTPWAISAGPGAVAERARANNQGPLYFAFVWLTTRSTGSSELTVRLPSLLAGLAVVGALYGLVRRWTGSAAAALLAAFLAAVDPVFIFYAQEARPYAMLQLVGLLQLGLLARLLEAPPARVAGVTAGVVVTSVLMFYLHYMAALVFAAEAAALAIVAAVPAWRARVPWRWLVAAGVAVAGLCGFAVPHLLEVGGHRARMAAMVPDVTLRDLVDLLPLRWLAGPAAAVLLAATVSTRRAGAPRPSGPLLVCVACVCLLPVLGVWGLTRLDAVRLFHPRYVIGSLTAWVALIGVGAAFCPTPRWRAAYAAIVAASGVVGSGVPQQLLADGRVLAERDEDWPAAVRAINDPAMHPTWPVLLCSGLIEDAALREPHDGRLVEYLRFPLSGLYRVARAPEAIIPLPTHGPGRLGAEQLATARAHGGAWVVLRTRHDETVREVVADLRGQLRVLGARRFGGVVLLEAVPE